MKDSEQNMVELTRRDFLATSASGLGTLALASILKRENLLAAEPGGGPGKTLESHFPAKAKACICIYMEGAPSQMDLFDPKPKLNELHGQKLPETLTKNVRFAFLQEDTAVVLGSKRKWQKYGKCGMELSDLLPRLGTVADDICLIR